jgi:Flp pilus assembly protein TadB
MHCNRSLAIHVMRGLGAIALVVVAFTYGNGWLFPALLIGAVLLLGGCPACWLTGLFDAIRARRNTDVGPAS